MKRMSRIVGALVLAAGLAACEPIDIDDGGGGGGGGNVLFTKGFAFVRGDDRNVYVVDDKGDPNSPQRLTTSGGTSHPAVSRNGRSVVFVQQTGTTFELRTVPTDGSAQPSTVLTSGTGCSGCTNFRYPTFNPAGTVIVFAFNNGAGNFALGKVNTDGSGFQALTNSPATSFGAPSFFPDGQSVLAPAGSSTSDLRQLARVTLTGTVTFITNNLGSEVQVVVNRAVVSPDGQQVALDGRLSVGSRIFVGPLNPYSAPVRVTDHPGEAGAQDTFPNWMSTTQLGFLSNAGGGQNIYRVSLPATTPGAGTLLIPTAGEPGYGGQ
jgi:TolB protein